MQISIRTLVLKLVNIEITSSDTNIGDWQFYDCSLLQNVYFDGTIDDWPPTLADDDFPLSLEQDAITRVAAMPAIRVNLLNDFFITRYYRQNSTNFKDPLIKVGSEWKCSGCLVGVKSHQENKNGKN